MVIGWSAESPVIFPTAGHRPVVPGCWTVSHWVFAGSAAKDGWNRERFLNGKIPGRSPGFPLHVCAALLQCAVLLQCARGDLNPHARRHRNLNPACLPISPLAPGSALCAQPAVSSGKTYDGGCQPQLYRYPCGPRGRRGPGCRAQGYPASASLRSLRSLATCPVARTLYWATATLPSWSTTTVERMRPS